MRDKLADFVLGRITGIMDSQTNELGRPVPWFFCFGTLQEFVVKRTFSLDHDIDVGVLYNRCDPNILTASFEGLGYKCSQRLLHDIDRAPLNLHFKPVEETLIGSPTVDVYFWYEHRGMLYHTYDVDHEGKEVPSMYKFKGVEKGWIVPTERQIKKARTPTAATIRNDIQRILDENGVYHYYLDQDGYSRFACPYKYGSLLDEWNPAGWLHMGSTEQSQTRWSVTMKSCKDWAQVR